MKKLKLTHHRQANATLLENEFIDSYMPEANGEYVKVYLLLLRHLSDSSSKELSVSDIADILDDTEKDVLRALKYWKKQGLLNYELFDPDKDPTPGGGPFAEKDPASSAGVSSHKDNASADVSSVPQETDAFPSTENVTRFRNRKELKELLFVAEQYMGKTLSATDMKTITYFYDTLGMSTDLIEYLIEYCVENGHKNIHYIQKVALSWSDQHITTVEAAKTNIVSYNRNYYAVLKAFGITGRSPAPSEAAYIQRWTKEFGLSPELILEACNRTMNSIHQPSFDYAESILKSWMEKGVKYLKDLEPLDEAYQKVRSSWKKAALETPKASRNKFNNFAGRNYDDMDDLTRKLIQNQ